VLIIIVQRSFEDRHSRWRVLRKKALDSAPAEDTVFPTQQPPRKVGHRLGYVCPKLLPELPFNGFHLVFEPQLQLLESDFFELFVFAEITLLG
jgi:hypothetical protein